MSEATRGQQNRREIRRQIEASLANYCPNTLDKLANLVAYDFNLSPYTVRYTYLPMYVDAGILEPCGDGKYTLTEKGKKLHRKEPPLNVQYQKHVQWCTDNQVAKPTYDEWLSQKHEKEVMP
jgi:predicted transcriptional regulator